MLWLDTEISNTK